MFRPLLFVEVVMFVAPLILIAGGVLVVAFTRTIQHHLGKLVGKIAGSPLNERDAAGMTAVILGWGVASLCYGAWMLVTRI